MRNSGFLEAKICAGATHWPIEVTGSHLWPSMDLLGPKQKRTHNICQRTFVRNRAKQTFLKCWEGKKNGRRRIQSFGMLYCAVRESLQKLAPWRMLRSSRSTKSYHAMTTLHVRQSCMGSLSQRDTKTDVLAQFLIFSNGVSAQQIEVITCQKYDIRGAPAI